MLHFLVTLGIWLYRLMFSEHELELALKSSLWLVLAYEEDQVSVIIIWKLPTVS